MQIRAYRFQPNIVEKRVYLDRVHLIAALVWLASKRAKAILQAPPLVTKNTFQTPFLRNQPTLVI